MRHLEDAESCALIAWRDLHVKKHRELRLLAHIPNGGYRNVREAARLKKMGVLPGVSDYFLPVPMAVNGAMPKRSFHRSEYHGLWIELKSAAGRLSLPQKEWLDAMDEQGYAIFEAHGWIAAAQCIARYLHKPQIAP